MGSEHRSSGSKRWKTVYGFDIKDSEILAEAARLVKALDDASEKVLATLADKWRAEGR